MEGFNTHGGVDLEVDLSVGFHVPLVFTFRWFSRSAGFTFRWLSGSVGIDIMSGTIAQHNFKAQVKMLGGAGLARQSSQQLFANEAANIVAREFHRGQRRC